jgi:hypothetical protein
MYSQTRDFEPNHTKNIKQIFAMILYNLQKEHIIF